MSDPILDALNKVLVDIQTAIAAYHPPAPPPPPPPLVQLPNLHPTAARVIPSGGAGAPVVFEVTVVNNGNVATPAGIEIGSAFSVDGVKVTWVSRFVVLAPGASTTLSTATPLPANTFSGGKWPAKLGSHVLTVLIDDVNRIKEIDKTDNLFTLPFTI